MAGETTKRGLLAGLLGSSGKNETCLDSRPDTTKGTRSPNRNTKGRHSMSKHQSHNMHQNSRDAFSRFDMPQRERDVCKVYQQYGYMTDREICTALGSKDMNYARPSITHLLQVGMIEESMTGTVCKVTNQHVRTCMISENPMYVEPSKGETQEQIIDRLTAELSDEKDAHKMCRTYGAGKFEQLAAKTLECERLKSVAAQWRIAAEKLIGIELLAKLEKVANDLAATEGGE